MTIKDKKYTIGVIGAGTMGAGIAQVSVQSGFDTLLYDISQEFIDKGLNRIKGFIQRSREKGKISADEEQQILASLRGTLKFEDFLMLAKNYGHFTEDDCFGKELKMVAGMVKVIKSEFP